MSNPFQKIKIVKLFASDDYKTRNKAHKVVNKLLKFQYGNARREINETDILGIWKGLYMWLWMQDKPILHEEVIGKICKLLPEIPSEKIAFEFINAFFITLMREWKKIDVHRMDKFYMLSRDFFGAILNWCQTKEREDEILTQFGTKVLNGVVDQGIEFKLHVVDILLDELVRAQSSSKFTTGMLLACIRSVTSLNIKNVYVLRMRKRVFDRIIPLYTESKLQVNLHELGSVVLEMAQTVEMFGKTKKMCYHLSNMFLNCKVDNPVEVMETENDADVANMEDKGIVNDVETTENYEAQVDGEEDDKEEEDGKEEDNVAMEEDNVMNNEDAAAADTDSMEEEPEEEPEPETVIHGKRKMLTRRIRKMPTICMEETPVSVSLKKSSSNERKVTFGKKYTKKFKKSDVNVTMSQGTTRNAQMKSILKKTR